MLVASHTERLTRERSPAAVKQHLTADPDALRLPGQGTIEVAAQIGGHESPRTTKLYDRRQEELSLEEIERVRI